MADKHIIRKTLIRVIFPFSIVVLFFSSCAAHKKTPKIQVEGDVTISDLLSEPKEPNIIVLKEYYNRKWGGAIVASGSNWVYHLDTHPNNVHGDYIILNSPISNGNGLNTYSEHIAAYQYDEFGVWYTRSDSLFMKPLMYSRWDTGTVQLTKLKDAKEKVFWIFGDYVYEVTSYDYENLMRMKITLYDTEPSKYLKYRAGKSDLLWQRTFKIMKNKELLTGDN